MELMLTGFRGRVAAIAELALDILKLRTESLLLKQKALRFHVGHCGQDVGALKHEPGAHRLEELPSFPDKLVPKLRRALLKLCDRQTANIGQV